MYDKFPFAEVSSVNRRYGNLLGICGPAGAGKDTMYRALRDIGVDCFRFAFADPLKQEVADLLQIPLAAIEKDKPRFRTMLQWYGTEWRRHQCDTYWTDRFEENLDRFDSRRLAVVTDVRFPNEANLIRSRGGKLIRIERSSNFSLTQLALSHESEQALQGFETDAAFLNPGNDESEMREIARQVDLLFHFPKTSTNN